MAGSRLLRKLNDLAGLCARLQRSILSFAVLSMYFWIIKGRFRWLSTWWDSVENEIKVKLDEKHQSFSQISYSFRLEERTSAYLTNFSYHGTVCLCVAGNLRQDLA